MRSRKLWEGIGARFKGGWQIIEIEELRRLWSLEQVQVEHV
nr:hypothetical protein [Nostoc punctiforme]